MWSNWGDPYYTSSSLTNADLLQPVIPNKNIILKYAKTQIILYNDPLFTSLCMKIYSYNENGSKGALIATSDSRTKAEIITLENGVKEIYFEFNNINLMATNTYNFALSGTNPTFTTTSFVAWKKGYPDPIYTENVTTTYTSPGKNPYYLYLVGSTL